MNRLKEALSDCNDAIALDEGYIKAYLRRAKCYMDLEQYDDAVRDYEKLNKMEKNSGAGLYMKSCLISIKISFLFYRIQKTVARRKICSEKIVAQRLLQNSRCRAYG